MTARRDPRRGARRPATPGRVEPMGRPFADFDTGALDPDLIPDDAFLIASVRWSGNGARGAVGVYQVDHARELCRPRCTCGWTTEGPTLFARDAADRLALGEYCSCMGDVWTSCRCGAQVLMALLTGHGGQHGLVVDLVKYPPHWTGGDAASWGGAG